MKNSRAKHFHPSTASIKPWLFHKNMPKYVQKRKSMNFWIKNTNWNFKHIHPFSRRQTHRRNIFSHPPNPSSLDYPTAHHRHPLRTFLLRTCASVRVLALFGEKFTNRAYIWCTVQGNCAIHHWFDLDLAIIHKKPVQIATHGWNMEIGRPLLLVLLL